MSTFIIAEAGVNHNGNLKTAFNLIDMAVNAGVDAVKFQTFIAIRLVSSTTPKAQYQKKTTSPHENQLEMIKKLQISPGDHQKLINYCKSKKIKFLSTPFDLESIDLLDNLGLDTFKIGSGELTNLPYLEKIGQLNKKVILSTGMGNIGEVEAAIDVLTKAGTPKENITLLHANTEYPTPMTDVNLRAMQTLKQTFKMKVGYSDHTQGIEVPIAAAALGAKVIEKHFTLDRTMAGPDHKASLEPPELKEMVRAIRNIEKALGTGIKKPSPSERKNMAVARKSIVAAKSISKGEIFTEDNITTKRPGTGISPMRWHQILGKPATRNYNEDDLI